MKRFLSIIIIIFLCGIITAEICFEQADEANYLLNLDRFRKLAYNQPPFGRILWDLVYERGKMFAFLLLLYLTPIRERVLLLGMIWFAFSYGFFLMSCMITLGIVGFVVAVTGVFPHWICYIGLLIYLVRRSHFRGYYGLNVLTQRVVTVGTVVVIFATGCVLECFMGVHFIPWLIRLSCL